MANIGLKRIYFWLVGSDGQVIKDTVKGLSTDGVYVVDTNPGNGNLGTRTANITGLSGTPTKIPGNDTIVAVSNPPSAPSVAINANAINFAVKQKLLGRVETKVKGAYTEGTTLPDVGLIIESTSPTSGKPIFYGFGRGKVTEASQNIQTNTDTVETREDDNLTFTALGFSGFPNEAAVAVADASVVSFTKSAYFDMCAPGQTLVTSDSDKSVSLK
ncbi:phage tail protein [Limosilactobacillus fermentum]|uniref:phage tail protein n=1 Tax=Limosilactobacillus fermentum TaxID=1613 RepID=UPI0021A4D1FD|nr:phage tail protein [Limosilactobacillus fermentum]MCT2870527.1 phage tail protein [Limosilactobacillus fermentum]